METKITLKLENLKDLVAKALAKPNCPLNFMHAEWEGKNFEKHPDVENAVDHFICEPMKKTVIDLSNTCTLTLQRADNELLLKYQGMKFQDAA